MKIVIFFHKCHYLIQKNLTMKEYVANLGIGKRMLSDNNNLMTGYNIFFDADEDGNVRSSLGGEIKNAVLGFNTNYYAGLQDATW